MGRVAMSPSRSHPLGLAAGIAAACLLLVSLALPVATAQQTQGITTVSGLSLLFIGPFGVLMGQFAWFANPCLLIAVFVLGRRQPLGRKPIVLAAIMAVLLIDALRWHNYPNDGGDGPITRYGLGYFTWITAMLLGIIGLLVGRFAEDRT
jgi:hypothetical protein